MGPSKGVAKGCFLTGLQLLEVEDVVGEQVFVLKGQPHVVQTRVIRTDGHIHPRFKTAFKDQAQLPVALEGTRLKISGGAHS